MIRRIFRHLHRMANARRLGVPFLRHKNFRMPAKVRLGGRTMTLAYPDEHGVRMDFMVCLIDDEYGLQQIERPVATIADIGANIGFFSLAARARFPDATIHSYEPNSRIIPFVSVNAERAAFQLYPEAVGAAEGWVAMEDSGDSNQARTTATANRSSAVRQVALATVVERLGGRIDLAKIDCEGAEWEMFNDDESWRQIADVRMEYHLWGRHVFADVEQKLNALGFDIYFHNPAGEWGTVWARNRSVPKS
ncbi:MAG: FkbM family methyltransferase [Verrucomicrobiota bacterium]|nr:FkbM family methyltransferase [Verrucomicrobiota bacterium]